ncbi:MAG: GNAT family N-acetyltransferase [Geminicoccaceae bacterium]
MDAAALEMRLALEHWLAAAFLDGKPVAALMGFREKSGYGSPNYRWFDERHERFIYVDRIMADKGARGAGAGRALYDAFIREFADGAPWIFCEVNELPPNPDSLAFHARLGFEPIGRLVHVPGEKQVAMLGRRLPAEGR